VLLQSLDSAASDQIRSVKTDQDLIGVSVHAGAPGLLVLSEMYYPGWQATVNGKSARIWQVDGNLRAVAVPAGDTTVALRYRPAAILFGVWLSGLTFLCVGGWASYVIVKHGIARERQMD
jgi:uncharacterized membrane protein YfhO